MRFADFGSRSVIRSFARPTISLHQVSEKRHLIVVRDLFSPTNVNSSVRSFILSFVRRFVRAFVRPFVRSFVRSSARSIVRAFVRSSVRLLRATFRRTFLESASFGTPLFSLGARVVFLIENDESARNHGIMGLKISSAKHHEF